MESGLKLKILGSGTSTGVPVPGCRCDICQSSSLRNKRRRTSALISSPGGKNILIDVSADFREQAIVHGIESLDAVLFTHSHADHIMGIDDLRGYNFVRGGALPCYANSKTLADIQHIFSYIFKHDPDYLGGAKPKLELHQIVAGQEFQIEDQTIVSFELPHGAANVLGFRFGDIGYATDCKSVPVAAREALKGVRYLVLDGLRYEAHNTHLTIPEAIEVAKSIGAEKTYLTHLTHTVDFDEVSAKLPTGIELAWDGLEICT